MCWFPLGQPGLPRDLAPLGTHGPTTYPANIAVKASINPVGNGHFFSGGIFTLNDSASATLSEMTVAIWAIVTDFSGNPNAIGFNGNSGWRIRINSSGNLNFLDRGGTNQITGSIAISTFKLVHIACAAGAAGLALYVNGVPDGTNATAFGAAGANGGELGGNGGGSENWVGWLFDVRVYGRRLAPAEIWQLYQPTSRWDLYWQPSSRVFFDVGSVTPPVTAAQEVGIFDQQRSGAMVGMVYQ